MLQELATETAAGGWATASMLFFGVVYLIVAVRVFRSRSDEMDAKARLALEDEDGTV